ncbi:aldo/keto reductase family protein [Methylovulum psychrotolerans]|uniref:Aldo/keto reductase n=1 Tax=Methylovulum psychrotolerans TaxID=1704499 RepID=A0A2S5CMS1_9GAMM|nr:aldo/keto reductase [Methylovulum psychrotolerans]POZ52057.1 aldo/keto reductase [Methylovulum psychrotolerans]
MSQPQLSISPLIDHRGVSVPTFLYGTAWKEERTEALTYQALKAGFLGIDTANQRRHYYEAAVGKAVQQAVVDGLCQRSGLFLQSKFTFVSSQDHRLPYDPKADYSTQVRQSLASSLEHLQTDYLDAFILHGPAARQGLVDADWQVWRTMENLCHTGVVKLLGISNVSFGQLHSLLAEAEIKPAFVQNRCYARSQWDAEIRALCEANGICYQGFSLLTANSTELQQAPILKMAQRLGCTVAQLVFRFALQIGMIPLTGSSNAQHLHDDLASYRLPELNPADRATIEQIGVQP